MKIIPYLCLLLLLTAVVACGAAATPTALPVAATPPPPTAIPTEPPPTEAPQQAAATAAVQQSTATPPQPTATTAPTATVAPQTSSPAPPPSSPAPTPIPENRPPQALVEIRSEHPAALLAVLPERASQFIYVNVETAMERPAFEELFQEVLSDFVRDEKSPAEELFRAAGVRTMALGFDAEREWYCILSGDFALMQDALRLATTTSGENPITELVEERHGVEIFGVFLERSYAQRDVLYLAAPDQDTLALTKDLDRMIEMVERRVNGGSLSASLVEMIDDWGLPDYLHAYDMAGFGARPPWDTATIFGVRVTLGEDENTTLQLVYQFDSDGNASEGAVWLQGQNESGSSTIGYRKRVQLSRWTSKGPTVYAQVTVPDEDAPDLVSDVTVGN